MRLVLEYPWYFSLLCLLLGAAYSLVLYFLNHRRLSLSPDFPRRTTFLLAALRFLVVSLVAFLLLAPLARRSIHQKERPIILVAQDNTSSLNACKGSAYYRREYAKAFDRMLDDLRHDYDVQCFTYGETLQPGSLPDYSERSTDIASALDELSQRFLNRNVGAVILSGDGIFNQGVNPASSPEKLPYPIYTIALGDTTVRKDASIANLKSNSLAYLGNQFPLEISVRSTRLKGNSRHLTVTHNGKTLFKKLLSYESDDFFTTETILLDADQPGLQSYTVTIDPVPGEASSRNNTQLLLVEVIDGRQKIAIVAASPHPDVSAIRQAVESNKNYEVETFIAKDMSDNLDQFDLVILHQIPARSDNSALLTALSKAHKPAIFVIGGLTDLARLNNLHLGLEIFSKIDRQNESAPLLNASFSNFELPQDISHRIEQFPPLISPFGDYRPSSSTQSLFTAKVGNVSSGIPLIAFSQQHDIRMAFVAGEGLWKWRLADFQANGSHEAFDLLISKMVTYTALRIDKERFRVVAQKVYPESSPVTLLAELYNDNYEPINSPEVELSLSHDNAKPSLYQFNRSGNNYSLSLGLLEPGSYHYEAHTTYSGKRLTSSGNFLVERLNLEELRLVADHSLLNTISQASNAEMLYPSQLEQLPQLLRQRHDIKNVIYSHTQYTELLNIPWLLILIVLLIGLEWVLRKYNGEI